MKLHVLILFIHRSPKRPSVRSRSPKRTNNNNNNNNNDNNNNISNNNNNNNNNNGNKNVKRIEVSSNNERKNENENKKRGRDDASKNEEINSQSPFLIPYSSSSSLKDFLKFKAVPEMGNKVIFSIIIIRIRII